MSFHRRTGLCLAVALFGSAAPVRAQLIDVTAPGNPIVGVAATVGSPTSTLATVGTIANFNNYPAAESPPNSIDNLLTDKYLNFQQSGAGFIVTPAALTRLTALDPATISLEGTNSPNATTTLNSTWSLIYSGISGLATDPGRDTFGATVNFTNTLTFASYRMLVSTVRTPASANSFQFDEIELFTPVPEPTSLVLAGLGLGAVLHRFRRRQGQTAA